MNTSSEERRAMIELSIETTFKTILSNIPVAGIILSDILFDYRSKIKQNRINNFVGLLREHFQNENPNINIDNIQTEQFSDLFDNILRKVLEVRGLKKQVAFKNILLKAMEANQFIDYCEIFTELLSKIHEKQIEILFAHYTFFNKLNSTYSIRRELDRKLYDFQKMDDNQNMDSSDFVENEMAIKSKLEVVEHNLEKNKHIRFSQYYNITDEEGCISNFR